LDMGVCKKALFVGSVHKRTTLFVIWIKMLGEVVSSHGVVDALVRGSKGPASCLVGFGRRDGTTWKPWSTGQLANYLV
jgi:hypothetical protein